MLSYTRTAAAVVAIGVALVLPGCSDAPEPATRQNPSTPAPSDAPREVVVATAMTTADLVNERVCLDQGGRHVLEAEAASENAATGFLTVDDGSEDGEYVTAAMRLAGQARQIRSEQVELHAGEPCYLVSAQTGITGERATTRLIKLDTQPEPVRDSESSVDSDEPTEFSAHTKQLLTLYEELHSFKDDPNFHDVGFGTCCRFHDWQTRVEALQSSAGLETLADIGVLPGDLLTLGMEYVQSKGRPTEYTEKMEPHYESGLAALAH